MPFEIIIDILGWIGASLVIAAYFLVSNNRVSSSGSTYQMLNLTGGILLIINTFYLKSYPSMAINIIWVVIAVAALIRMIINKG
ncbi:MAG: hypothetical protein NW207_11035 [Cytophagales bacterium]|nr:hypothetical protein [Cytophagales bacterium]